MKELLKSKLLCTPNFDENGLFDAEEKVRADRFWNIGADEYILDWAEKAVCQVCTEYNTDDGLCGLRAMWGVG